MANTHKSDEDDRRSMGGLTGGAFAAGAMALGVLMLGRRALTSARNRRRLRGGKTTPPASKTPERDTDG